MPVRIEHDSEVAMEFELKLADGTPVDAMGPEEPFVFQMGSEELPAGIERYLLGLAEGDERVLEIPAAEAYGEATDEGIQHISRSEFPADWELTPGSGVTFSLPDGSEVPATIMSCSDDEVEVDFSHPLSGHDIVMNVKILRVRTPESV